MDAPLFSELLEEKSVTNVVNMEEYGYCLYTSAQRPEESLLQDVENSVGSHVQPRTTPTTYFDSADCPKNVKELWKSFINDGINLPVILLSLFENTSTLQLQGPIIVSEIVSPLSTTTALRRSHPCRDGVSVWRPIRKGVGPEDGLFKVYPKSHRIESEQKLRESGICADAIRIRADQVLITHGGLWIEEQSGAGLLMWMGFSEESIGLHIDMHSLLFIALACGASHFLSRHRSLSKVEWETAEFAQEDFSFTPQDRHTGSGNGRTETAESILIRAQEGLEEVQKFITELGDPTKLILSADYGSAEDPRTAFLTVGRDLDPRKWFLRAVSIRYLVKRYWWAQNSIRDFVNEEGLPDKPRVHSAIKCGQKVYLEELALKKPGIWLVLMGVLSRFPLMPLSEVYLIPSLLHDKYPAIIDAALRWSRLMANSGWFGTDLGDAKRENTIMDDLEFVRVWFPDSELSPEAAVWHHALDDVVKLIVPLPCKVPVPCQGGYIGYKKLADLAVDKDGVERVRSRYEAVRSVPLGSEDPMVVAQKPRDLTLKRFEACKQLRDTYRDRLEENDIDNQGRTWLERQLQSTVKGPLMRDAEDKGIGHMILEEVQLEDPSNGYAPAFSTRRPAGAMLVDLAVLPEHAATVRSKYFSPFSSDDPLVCSEPGNDIDLKRALAFRKIISRYDKAQRIRQAQGQIPGPENELIRNWFSKRMMELEGLIKTIHGCETIRIWCRSYQEDPMASVRSNGLHDVVRAAVPLQDPNYRRVAEDKTVHPDGAILVDLAVHKEGVRTVLRKYGVIDFVPMGDDDPVVLSQPGETMKDKQVAAYENMLKRYSRYPYEECRLLGPMAKVWVAEKLAGIENQLSVIHPNRLETIRIRCPRYQSHPWEIIQKLGLGDVVREAIPLEVQTIFQESVQVDLAVEPSGISRVRTLCEVVDFQKLSEDDPIIQIQPDGDPRMRAFNGYNHVLQRFQEARALRQIDGALMLWYEKEITDLESRIRRLRRILCPPSV
ncbi:hypothetical protein LV156_009019 [Aspergillus fumigatus]|nr:hypothetical protein LV162_008861 [Aspergillus fumigatus]KAJ8226308.1 hypothetical protein LV156_009019 [Aspergillus fumigatus]